MKLIHNEQGICTYKTQSGVQIGTRDLPSFIKEFDGRDTNMGKKLSEVCKRPSGVNDRRVSWQDQLKAVRKHIN